MAYTAEQQRLNEARDAGVPWRKWGPYLSERQWGTVREDYSHDGNAWEYFTHDQARARAYRWGEDGLAGISDEKQYLCFALALWNGVDPIIKERLFGLTNAEGNHGEDVKEYYYYLDNTPTHSYMEYLYKYPQRPFPYNDLVRTNRQRSRKAREYELINTGVFDEDRYFDVLVEYAKVTPEDICIRITAHNRGPEQATLHILPMLWFRNTWSWTPGAGTGKPRLEQIQGPGGRPAVHAWHPELGDRYLYCQDRPDLLFTENETNLQRIAGHPNPSPYVKDGIDRYLVHKEARAISPAGAGTKVAADYAVTVAPADAVTINLRLCDQAPEAFHAEKGEPATAISSQTFAKRLQEADEFYASVTPPALDKDSACIMRQALAGMLWSKQYYQYRLAPWLDGHGASWQHSVDSQVRNAAWFHMVNSDIISMPDKWEYPWYAAWDLAFHTVPLAIVDPDFAKQQLGLMLSASYLHPSGQVPAYEWNFGDVNPPVHAIATLLLYEREKTQRGVGDLEFLKRNFQKLVLNFTWWVNRKDHFGRNIFEGGFLGLDNIGVFDRSAPLPTGGHLEQADGTAWMAMYCQNMLAIAIELATHDHTYDDMALKFIEHFAWIAMAMNRADGGRQGLWNETDGFYYDVLQLPDGSAVPLKVRSLVGLLPLCATTILEKTQREAVPGVFRRIMERMATMPELARCIHPTGPGHLGVEERGILAVVRPDRLRRILTRMLDENEFLSPYGIRSISRYHAEHPYVFRVGGQEYRVDYLPAESDTGLFGGNSNWRGPIWFPINVLLTRALRQFHLYYGDNFRIECPTGSGKLMNLNEVADEISRRLIAIFHRDDNGRRPVNGDVEKFQSDPYWRNLPRFYEYFHGDSGAGLGACCQTGWTGLVARLLERIGQGGATARPEVLPMSVQRRRAAVTAAPATSSPRVPAVRSASTAVRPKRRQRRQRRPGATGD